MLKEMGQKYAGLPIFIDESGHEELVSDGVHARLYLVNSEVILTFMMAHEAETRYRRGTTHFFILRSLARVANFARLSNIGLLFGFYAGAASELRMAYETLLYTFLFDLKPDKALSWLRLTLDLKLDQETYIREEQGLRALAKGVFSEWTGEKDLGPEICEHASRLINHTIEGLAAEVGLEPWQLMPDEFIKALEASERDFDSVIKLTSLVSRFVGVRDNKQIGKERPGLPWTEQFGVLYDEEWLDFLSMALLYFVHRMTDFAYQRFPPSDKKISDAYQSWHQEVKNMS